MSYRDEILDYVGECLEGVEYTLESERVNQLNESDLKDLARHLKGLSSIASDLWSQRFDSASGDSEVEKQVQT